MKRGLRSINFILMFVMCFGALGFMPKQAIAQEPAMVIINEVDASTPTVPDTADFLELYDGGIGNTSLEGLVLVYYNGSNNLSYAAIDLYGPTDTDGYFVLCTSLTVLNCDMLTNVFQNGPDAIALYQGNKNDFPTGTAITLTNLIDAIVYDTSDADDPELLVLLNPGQPQVDEDGGGSGITQSNQRCPNGSGGFRNTDTYTQSSPTPGTENCPIPPDQAPTVTLTSPNNGSTAIATDTNINITFSEPVTLAADWYEIDCSVSGLHTATVDETADPVIVIDPTSDFVPGDVCEVTIFASKVEDDDTIDPPGTMASNFTLTFTMVRLIFRYYLPLLLK